MTFNVVFYTSILYKNPAQAMCKDSDFHWERAQLLWKSYSVKRLVVVVVVVINMAAFKESVERDY